MQEHELWITALFNNYLGGVGNSLLALIGQHAHDPVHPWTNFVTMQILVAIVLIGLIMVLRSSLSVDNPGKLQHIFELIYDFLHNTSEEIVGHNSHKYLSFFVTLFLFILTANLIGLVPGLEAPTMSPAVPLGCALAAFAYYNWQGIKEFGPVKYGAHFAGPLPALAPLMIPIELISHLARPLSLTIRLFANMYAGEQVTLVFLSLTYLFMPAVFMGLHFFVGILQAYVFVLLTMMYVGGAVAHEH